MKFSKYSKMFLGLLFSLVAVLWFAGLSQASTWRVERDGSGDFTTIQPAVDVSAAGDTILIGPGNYTEVTTVDFWTQPTDVFVNVTTGDLTFIGTSADEVIIGPDEYYPTYQGPLGFAYNNISSTLRIENVSIVNVGNGCVSLSGRLEVIGCKINDIENYGIFTQSSAGLFVDNCSFSVADGGVFTYPPCDHIVIQNSIFFSASIDVIGAADVVMENCSSVGLPSDRGLGIAFDNSSGVVSNCEFTGQKSVCIAAISGSNVAVENCTMIADGYVNVGVGIKAFDNSTVVTVNQCIIDGSFAAIQLRGGAQVAVDSSHINTTGEFFVHCISYGGPQVEMDFTNNYWGTTDLDLIASKIIDANDFDNLSVTIVFDPVADGPLSTSETTLDGLKAMFRDATR